MPKYKLHKHGFQVYNKSIEITDDIFDELTMQSNASKSIFNHNKNNHNDKKRKQCPIVNNKKIIKNLSTQLDSFVCELNLL